MLSAQAMLNKEYIFRYFYKKYIKDTINFWDMELTFGERDREGCVRAVSPYTDIHKGHSSAV